MNVYKITGPVLECREQVLEPSPSVLCICQKLSLQKWICLLSGTNKKDSWWATLLLCINRHLRGCWVASAWSWHVPSPQRKKKHWSKIGMKLWWWRLKRTMGTSEGVFAVFCCKAAFQKDSKCWQLYIFFNLKVKNVVRGDKVIYSAINFSTFPLPSCMNCLLQTDQQTSGRLCRRPLSVQRLQRYISLLSQIYSCR